MRLLIYLGREIGLENLPKVFMVKAIYMPPLLQREDW
jgi:hypothetical protein